MFTFNGVTIQPTLQEINRVRASAGLPDIPEWQAIMAFLVAGYATDAPSLIPTEEAADVFGGVEGFHRALGGAGFADGPDVLDVVSDPGFMKYLQKLYEATENPSIATLTNEGFAPGLFRYFQTVM